MKRHKGIVLKESSSSPSLPTPLPLVVECIIRTCPSISLIRRFSRCCSKARSFCMEDPIWMPLLERILTEYPAMRSIAAEIRPLRTGEISRHEKPAWGVRHFVETHILAILYYRTRIVPILVGFAHATTEQHTTISVLRVVLTEELRYCLPAGCSIILCTGIYYTYFGADLIPGGTRLFFDVDVDVSPDMQQHSSILALFQRYRVGREFTIGKCSERTYMDPLRRSYRSISCECRRLPLRRILRLLGCID